MSNRFIDKVAIITGAGDGMGRATAKRLLAEGGKVVACDISREKIEAAHEAHPNLLLLEQDVSHPDAADRLVGAAVESFGALDIVVNNAGISTFLTIEAAADADWDRMFDVNLKAIFRLCRRAIPELRRRGQGRIVNIASVNAVRSRAGLGLYSSTKAGLAGLTHVLAIELGADRITANYILPGAIWTGLSRGAIAAEPRWEQILVEETALGRIGNPEEIAGAVAFLASDDASFITGHGLVVDGGALVKM